MTQILPKVFVITFIHTVVGTPFLGKAQILLACYRSWAEKKRKENKSYKNLKLAVSFCCFFLRHKHNDPDPPTQKPSLPQRRRNYITLTLGAAYEGVSM